MAMELKCGKMVASTMETGQKIQPTAMVSSSIVMEISMKGLGKMTGLTGTELSRASMVPSILESGRIINDTELVLKSYLTEHNMKDTLLQARKMVMAAYNSQTGVHILDNFQTMKYLDKVNTAGLIGANIKGTLKIIISMDKESSSGPT